MVEASANSNEFHLENGAVILKDIEQDKSEAAIKAQVGQEIHLAFKLYRSCDET